MRALLSLLTIGLVLVAGTLGQGNPTGRQSRAGGFNTNPKQNAAPKVPAEVKPTTVVRQHQVPAFAKVKPSTVVRQHQAPVLAEVKPTTVVRQHQAPVPAEVKPTTVVRQHQAPVLNIAQQGQGLSAFPPQINRITGAAARNNAGGVDGQQIFDRNGRPILNQNGNPVFLRNDGSMFARRLNQQNLVNQNRLLGDRQVLIRGGNPVVRIRDRFQRPRSNRVRQFTPQFNRFSPANNQLLSRVGGGSPQTFPSDNVIPRSPFNGVDPRFAFRNTAGRAPVSPFSQTSPQLISNMGQGIRCCEARRRPRTICTGVNQCREVLRGPFCVRYCSM